MSREIKFRIWSDMMGRMESVSCIDFGGNEVRKGCPCAVVLDGDGCIPLENTELMQFTGLKDKHGKEIYEGDIVKLNDGTQGEEIKAVEFINGGFHVSDGEYIAAIFAYASDMPELSRIEVIGNVHQNPELLEAGE